MQKSRDPYHIFMIISMDYQHWGGDLKTLPLLDEIAAFLLSIIRATK